ncbi:EAL domain-containing protein [Shewanella sp. AS16]|uniref:EAL domain-containing protein n=1 Tax=Shewanella sp. AS16 TaxID=2907625 RepID=UPI001F28DF67|nr:EAL domain-containing protein [Shewanella sp. AS16]MCE9687551.1 EAL domain-containing protein [Shewanella sp. AS16]
MIIKIINAILACILFFAVNIESVKAKDLVQRVFSAKEGLANASIQDISVDEHGFIWLATEQGLYRVSNSKVRRIDKIALDPRIADEYIYFVINLDKDHLLVSTLSEIYLYDIAANEFERFGDETRFPHYHAGGIEDYAEQADGSLLLLTSSGAVLSYSHRDNVLESRLQLPQNQDFPWHQLLLLDDGRLLLATARQVELRDAGGLILGSLPWSEASGQIKGLFKDSRGRIWMSSSEGLYSIDVPGLSMSPVAEIPYYVTKMAEDPKGNFWIASRSGLLKWSPDTHRLEQYQQQLKQQADIEYIYDILVDKSGLVWVGGSGDGLALVADKPDFLLDTFTDEGGYRIANEMIWSVFTEGDIVWMGTDAGLVRADRATGTSRLLVPEGLELNDSIYKIDSLDAASLLLSTTNGLFVVDKQSLRTQSFGQWAQGTESLQHKMVFNTLKDPKIPGRIWFATSGGLFFWEPGLKAPAYYPLPQEAGSESHPMMRTLFRASDGKLWLGGEKLFGYLEAGKFHSRFDMFDAEAHLPAVYQIDEVSPGVLWFGTAQTGLYEFKQQSGELTQLNRQWQVECPSVYFLQQTADFRVVGCANGIVRQRKSDGKLAMFGEDDGFISDELNEDAVSYSADGLYLGTPDGLMLVDVAGLSNRIVDDSVFLESVSVYYDEQTEVALLPEKLSRVRPGASMISFQITSHDYLDATPMQLKYRLRRPGEPLGGNYVLLQGQAQINVSGLAAGNYTLELLSKKNGIWLNKPYSFSFAVAENWWQSRWFKGIWLLIATLVILASFVIRQRQVSAFKTMNLALLESDDRLRQSLKGSDSDLWEWRDGIFFMDNSSGVLGYLQQVSMGLDDIPIYPEDKERVLTQWRAMFSGESDRFEVEYRILRSDGESRWLRVSGRPVARNKDTGEVERVAGIYSDITQQRQLEDDVNLLAQAFENTSEGVLILDADEKIKVSNSAARRIINCATASLEGKHFSELMSATKEAQDDVATLLQESTSWTGERELLCGAQRGCPVWLNVSTMQGAHSKQHHYVVVFSDITERKRSEADLRRLANYDVLTGLPNRSLFSTRLAQAIDKARRTDEKLALLFLDLDRFKHVNDSYGHSMGDALLVEAANRLQSCMSDKHVLCRFGGDEFVLLVRDAGDLDKLNHLAERLLEQIVAPFKLFGREFYLSTSIGISIWPDDAVQPEALIKNADLAMYHAKDEGRGNFQYYSSERNAEALYHLRLEADLRKALEREEFELYYQPQIDVVNDDKLVGMEALLRWKHPKDGYIRPDVFIKVAEACGLIVDIDSWVLRQACLHGARWSKLYSEPFKLSVNISAIHFRQPDFIDGIKQVLHETQIPPRVLALEITEGVLMKELHVAKSHLKQLKLLGIDVAIDDFGTGYSSLAYLRHFEVNSLKIDRSFLIDIASNAADQAIVSSIIELARNLKLNVVAEGIETVEQLEQVFGRGCYVIQGYYFAKPMPLHEMDSYLGLLPCLSDAGTSLSLE